MKPVVIKRQIINDMETISITYRGLVHKLTEYEKLADTIETIYAMCDQKITHWADSITGKNGGKVKKYKRGKILYLVSVSSYSPLYGSGHRPSGFQDVPHL